MMEYNQNQKLGDKALDKFCIYDILVIFHDNECFQSNMNKDFPWDDAAKYKETA